MPTSTYISIAIIIGLTNMSCNSSDSTTSFNNSLELLNETDIDNGGLYFLKTAFTSGIREIEVGKLAMQKAYDVRIKKFARMMVQDHLKLNKELYKIGKDQHLLMPNNIPLDLQNQIIAMQKLSAIEFDKHYMNLMVLNHQSAIQNFQTASRNRKKIIKRLASSNLKMLEMHLSHAEGIYESLSNARTSKYNSK